MHGLAPGSGTLSHTAKYVGQTLELMQDVKHIAMARLALPDNGLHGAQSCPLVSYRIVGIEALVTGVQQMDGPGVGVAVTLGGEQIAVGRVGIDTGQDGLVALEDFVMQSHTNRREILRAVDCTRAASSHLMQVVNAALADGYSQNVTHEFHLRPGRSYDRRV